VTRRESTRLFPVLLLEPDTATAVALASELEAAGFDVRICGSARSALRAVESTFFFALIVDADLTSKDCLVTLEELRSRASRSWMIVAAPDCEAGACNLIHRYGGDACVAFPISLDDLVHRLDVFHLRTRPSI
jgi:DNA-binding response OmpR family regulator